MWTDPHLRFAVEIVAEASILVRRIQAEMVSPALAKADRSPVTVADFAAQAIVAETLEAKFPGETLVGEESSADLRTEVGAETLATVTQYVSQRRNGADQDTVCQWIDRGAAEPGKNFWTLDPVDGTKGFLRNDQYAVALAKIEVGKVQLGVLGCPALDSDAMPGTKGAGVIVVAVRGKGCWAAPLSENPIDDGQWVQWKTSPLSETAKARLLRSVESGHTNTSQIDALVEKLSIQAAPLGMDSQAKYAALAAGQAELIIRMLSPSRPDYQEKIWDQAAGSIVVEEAGGRVTDLTGQPLDFSHGRTLANNRGVVATNGPLHDSVLTALAELGA